MKKKLLSALITFAPPAALVLLFYILRNFRGVMDAVRPAIGVIRRGIGAVTSLLPFSLYEIGLTALIIALLVIIIRTVAFVARRDAKGRRGEVILRRATVIVTVAGYVLSAFLWLWCTLYYCTPFYDGVLVNAGVTDEELYAAAAYYLAGANEYAALINRDADGNYAETAKDLVNRAKDVLPFDELRESFPRLQVPSGKNVKSMLYSEIMSITGFTGIYFAVTAEPNVNVNAPAVTMPTTIAHELSHSLGVAPEDQTDYLGITLCVMSDDVAYKYSGYLSGFIRLANALSRASMFTSSSTDSNDYWELMSQRSDLVRRDMTALSDYWAQYNEPYRPSEIGSVGDALDAIYAAAVEVMSDTTEAVYDGYLKSQGQALGIRSYGACVDLIVEWTIKSSIDN